MRKYDSAIGLVRTLATSRAWTNWDESQYRPYAFPRSQMLAAIEEAVAAEAPDGKRPSPNDVLTRLGKLSWRPAKPAKNAWVRVRASLINPATLLGACALAVYTRYIAAASLPWVLASLAAPIACIGLFLLVQQNYAPLSWLGTTNWWFATTTFLRTAGAVPDARGIRPGWLRVAPRRAWRIREARAALVISRLITAYYPTADESGRPSAGGTEIPVTQEGALRFYLDLRVHALLMDLHGNHGRWYPDLRHWKRTYPPAVFLPDADNLDGGIELLQSVSDLRSRRSEIDPLLIVARSQSLHTRRRDAAIHPESGTSTSKTVPYEQWASRVQVEQSPSLGSHWPWVLLYSIPAGWLWGTGTWPTRPRARRTPWNLWSRWMLLPAMAAGIAGIVFSSLPSGDPDGECIGVNTTGFPECVPAGGGVTLSGAVSKAQAGPGVGSGIDLADLENLIGGQNVSAMAAPHVTFVYAGALTAPAGSSDPVDAVEELAGMYTWQSFINGSNDPVKIRIDIANDGDGSAHERDMADDIAAAARQDPTIVGVVGLGVDTQETAGAVQELAAADLPVIDTTNSDVNLPDDWNYFGLSSTNKEEAQQLVSKVSPGQNRWAIVFERGTDTGREPDTYTAQQATAAEAALKGAGFRLAGGEAVTYTSGALASLSIPEAICAQRPSVVYFAGRRQDLTDLTSLLSGQQPCFSGKVTVLSGDDMAPIEYPGTAARPLAPQMTLYYTTQTAPAYVGQGDSQLARDFVDAFSPGGNIPPYSAAPFADGLLSLGFDAAHALYKASTTNDQSQTQVPLPRAAVAPTLRCQRITGGATGQIGFADVRHGLDIFEAVNTPDDNQQKVTPVSHVPAIPGTCNPNVAP